MFFKHLVSDMCKNYLYFRAWGMFFTNIFFSYQTSDRLYLLLSSVLNNYLGYFKHQKMNVPEFALRTCLEYLNKKDLDFSEQKKRWWC